MGFSFPRVNLSAPSMSADVRRQLHESDRQWHVKFALRLIAGLFSLIAFSLFAAAIPTWNQNFFHVSGPQQGDWQDGLPISALVISFLFNAISIGYQLSTRRPAHPAVNLTVDLIVWVLLVPGVTFAAWGGLFEVWRPAIKNVDGTIDCNILNTFAKQCNPILYKVGGLELGGVVLSCFVWALTFTTFVLACIDLHHRRMASRYNLSTTTTSNGHSTSPSSYSQTKQSRSQFLELGERRRGSSPHSDEDDLEPLQKERMMSAGSGRKGALKMPGKTLGKLGQGLAGLGRK